MAQFITIAGPQSSGKTTALEFLKKKYPKWYFVEDINPYNVAGENHPGGAYTSEELEIKISEIVLVKIKKLLGEISINSATEMGIFHSVYMKFFGRKHLYDHYYDKYLELYNSLNSHIIFIDTEPKVSFARRRDKYIQRIEKMGITDEKEMVSRLKKYESIIYKLYPYWIKFYEKLPFPKTVIKNSYLSRENFLKEIDRIVSSLLTK